MMKLVQPSCHRPKRIPEEACLEQTEGEFIQESQEQRDASHATPVLALRSMEAFWHNLSVRFEAAEPIANASMVEAQDKGKENTTLHEPTGGPQQQQGVPNPEWAKKVDHSSTAKDL